MQISHNGYIGTLSLSPSTSGTGLRGYSLLATVKSYLAPNLSPLAGGDFAPAIKYSCIEGPQGITMFRGQVQLDVFSAVIDIDMAKVIGAGKLLIPHDNPLIAGIASPPGTFNAMFQNPMVNVTNAGTWNGVVPLNDKNIMTLEADIPNWTRVHGSIIQTAIPGFNISNTQIKISADSGGTPNLVVNYIVYAERRDEGYINNPQVREYHNPFTKSMKTWGSATDLSGNSFPGK